MAVVLDRSLVDTGTFTQGTPHDYFDYLRREDPCHGEPNPLGGTFWSLTRADDIRALSMNLTEFTSGLGILFPNHVEKGPRKDDNLIFNGGERHARLRGLISKAFSPRVVAKFEHWIREICVRIVDDVKKTNGEPFDAIRIIAAELPMQVVASIIGVPDHERHLILKWTNDIFGRQDPTIGIEGHMRARDAVEDYSLVLRDIKRDAPAADMATELQQAVWKDSPITDTEYQQSISSLLTAGFETTHTLISQSLLMMARDPSMRDQVYGADPKQLRAVVEELLRFVSPVRHMGRTAVVDTEIRGKQIKTGDFVAMWFCAGNRDPDVYQNPHQFDVNRKSPGNLSFGAGGPHFCVGAHLAKLEVEILLDEFRKADIRLELAGEPKQSLSVAINSLDQLPMRLVV